MICFECAKVNETSAAVAVCQHCGVGFSDTAGVV